MKISDEIYHEVGINNLADLSDAEYQRLLGYKSTKKDTDSFISIKEPNKSYVPVDWRALDKVTPVKD